MSAHATTSPLVSILINNYNYGRFIEEAITSALAQDYPDVEVVVVDDGSTDESRDLIAQFATRITILYQDNSGQAAAFNAGFAASRGDIICLLDADDRFRPGKVAAVVSEYRSHPAAQWCFHRLALFGDRAHAPARERFPVPGDVDVRADMHRGKLNLVAPATSGLTFRRELLAGILPMPTDIRITSDNYIKFAVLGTSPGFFVDAALAEQRIHGANAYTMRPGASALRGEIAVLTAVHLRRRFPELRRFANGLFGRGLSRIVPQVLLDVRIRHLVVGYLRNMHWSERLRLLALASINLARSATER